MSAQPGRRTAASELPSAATGRPRSRSASQRVDRAVRIERRRRVQHLRRRRRDLLEDVAMAVVLTIVVMILTAGLGVVAIIEVPVAVAVLGSVLMEREIRKRRIAHRSARRPSRSPRKSLR